MNDVAIDFWERSLKSLSSARLLMQSDADGSASRSYYSAFYAASAHFALEGRIFKKHSAVESAVHRDLVKPGYWSRELGTSYSSLMKLRSVADYGGFEHVSENEAEEATQVALNIIKEVYETHPDIFLDPDGILQ